MGVLGVLLVSMWVFGADAVLSDLQRARAKVPHGSYRGDSFADMGSVLTKHLRAKYGEAVKECVDASVADLRKLQTWFYKLADPQLTAVYAESQDERRERHDSIETLTAHWENLQSNLTSWASRVLRDGLCHEVVMRFVHHTTEDVQSSLLRSPGFWLPTLPTERHVHGNHAKDAAVLKEYVALTGCQSCHSRLVPLSGVSEDCASTLESVCGKYGSLSTGACQSCFSSIDAVNLGTCSSDDTSAWCDHPDACSGSEECPVWPKEFSAPFTLYSNLPIIRGAKCEFYYSYTEERQVQTVSYPEKCFPFVNAPSETFSDLPCTLWFNPSGIFLSQPGRVDCCTFKAGVGAVPPQFLQSMSLVGQDVDAPDMYGNTVKCDEWEGQTFKYWTVGRNDPLYKNVGHDIVFQDGPTGVTWRWGNFNVTSQPADVFELPTVGDCSESCPTFLTDSEMDALHRDPHVRRSIEEHHRRAALQNDVVV